MRLEIDSSKCNSCRGCLASCPNGVESLKSLLCKHCGFDSAACVRACRRNAFYEVAAGIISVDTKACNGCGECAKACGAISIANGKAAKCDLCAPAGFAMLCSLACQTGAISVTRLESAKELGAVRKALGWCVERPKNNEVKMVLAKRNENEIIENASGERVYLLKCIPELTLQEAELVRAVVSCFRETSVQGEEKGLACDALKQYCESRNIVLDNEQQGYLLAVIELLVFGLGPVSALLEDDELEEIAAVGSRSSTMVYVYDRCFGWLRTNLTLRGSPAVRDLVNKMARVIGRRLTMQNPKLNAVLPDGSRLSAAIEPVSFAGACFTVRKFRQKPFSPAELVINRTLSAEALAFLWMALGTDCSVLICGNTGSGKTTTLNALFEFVPLDERIIVTEETPEIRLRHRHVVRLNVADELGIGMGELITETLRMRPDRIIVGEIRNRAEVGAFLDTILAGQGKGSYATFHAQSADEALARLRNLGVSSMDLAALDLVVVQRRWTATDLVQGTRTEMRRVVEIAEVLAGEQPKLNRLFGFDYAAGALEQAGRGEKIMEKMMRTYNLGKKALENALRERAVMIAEETHKSSATDSLLAALRSRSLHLRANAQKRWNSGERFGENKCGV